MQVEVSDGFYEAIVMEDLMDARTLLVYEMNGAPLTAEHGFPLRAYIPDRCGMKQPKWIERITAIEADPRGYWVQRGWSRTAVMRTTSVIDTAATRNGDQGQTIFGGIAHAGDRGISKVEVSVDGASWQEAELREPALGPLTWPQWRFEEDVRAGEHAARVRACDGDGVLQIAEDSPPHPDGATGSDSLAFEV